MHKRKCIVCGKEFESKRKTVNFCSQSCYSKKYHKKYYEEHYKKKFQKKCPVCGKIFESSIEHQVYCSKNCRDKHHRESNTSYTEIYIKCPVCGEEFKRTGKSQKYCSAECRNKSLKPWTKPKICECAYCGKKFSKTSNQKYCSADCRYIAYTRPKCTKKQDKRKPPKSFMSLNEAARLSKETGLSYGQFVARGYAVNEVQMS